MPLWLRALIALLGRIFPDLTEAQIVAALRRLIPDAFGPDVPIARKTTVETFNATQLATQNMNLPAFVPGDAIHLTIANNPDGTATIGTITSNPGVAQGTPFTQLGNDVNTNAASDGKLSTWVRIMEAGDPSTISMQTSTAMSIGVIATAYEGVDPANPEDVPTPAYNTGTGNAISPSATTVTDGARVIRSALQDGAPGWSDSSIPAGTTLLGTIVQNPPSNGMNLGAADEVQATAGATGTATWSNGGSEEYVGATTVLRPITAGITDVTPDEFDYDESNLVIDGQNFGATQGTGTVWIANAVDLATSFNEVDIGAAVTAWSDTQITLNLQNLPLATQNLLENGYGPMGPGLSLDGFIIVVSDASDEYSFDIITHRIKAIFFQDSPNITAEGPTTAQMTPPAGKTTGDFAGGRISEAPQVTGVDVPVDDYREDEFSIQLGNATILRDITGDQFVLRVAVFDGTVLDTYPVETPRVTIASPTLDLGTAQIDATSTVAADLSVAMDIDGQVDAVSSLAGAFDIGPSFDAQIDAVSGVSGDLDARPSLSIDILSASGMSGDLDVGIDFSVSIDSISTGSGSLAIGGFALDSFIDSVSSLAADLDVGIDFDVTIAADSTFSADLTVIGPLDLGTADIAAVSALSGDMDGNPALEVAVLADSGLSGALDARPALEATVSSASSVSGDLVTAGEFSASISASSSMSADLDLDIGLEASSDSVSAITATLTTGAFDLTATVSSQSAVDASLGLRMTIELASAIAAITDITADTLFGLVTSLDASIDAVSDVSGQFDIGPSFSAQIDAASDLAGDLLVDPAMAVSIDALSTLTASLLADPKLDVSIDAFSQLFAELGGAAATEKGFITAADVSIVAAMDGTVDVVAALDGTVEIDKALDATVSIDPQ